MRYENDTILAPEDGETFWRFSQDLREFFPGMGSNHEITTELVKRGVLKSDNDSESACSHFYFENDFDALAFLKRLNEQPEIQNYKESKFDVNATHVMMTESEWNRLREFAKSTLTPEQYKRLQDLNLSLFIINP